VAPSQSSDAADLFANPTMPAPTFTASVQSIGGGRRLGIPAPVDARCEEEAECLSDRMPVYITWDQDQRNQAQLQSNRAVWGGAPRSGSALLSGVITCGCCGMRMTAHYNHNDHKARSPADSPATDIQSSARGGSLTKSVDYSAASDRGYSLG
jgi:hypothetical protein